MSDLLLRNLEIRSFRGFRHLKIERLGRINLIVGKNNVGKSALLEALRLYAAKRSPAVILELLRPFGEVRQSDRSVLEVRLVLLKYLFYGRKVLKPGLEPIQIGPIDQVDERLSINVIWQKQELDETGAIVLKPLKPEEYDIATGIAPLLVMKIGKMGSMTYQLDGANLGRLIRDFTTNIGIFLRTNGLDTLEISRLWDNIALTNLEQYVLAALRVIAPGVERLNFIADDAHLSERVPIVKVADIDEPLPLSNLGDGMSRMLGIALALVNAKDGMVLIDEIENGLHYSAQPDMWRIIFQLARQLNIQVFATCHSWDCIEAFQQAAEEDIQTEGLLIRLEYKKGDVVPTLFDERKLNIATNERIEVR